MGSNNASTSPLYLLEKFDAGIVHLDARRHVVAMNNLARQILPVDETQPFDKMVLSFHPERSQPKLTFMLDQAAQCPVANPPPMTMIINIPERVLLIKVSKLSNLQDELAGYSLVFYDITEMVSHEAPQTELPNAKRELKKIPTVMKNRTVLVEVETVQFLRAEGHYTWVHADGGSSFCNLNIGDIASRLPSETFMRVHRSYLVNLEYAEQIVREGGKVSLQLRGSDDSIPVSRDAVRRLRERLGITEISG